MTATAELAWDSEQEASLNRINLFSCYWLYFFKHYRLKKSLNVLEILKFFGYPVDSKNP